MLDDVFQSILRKLRQKNKILFPLVIIRDSALFKASPFHKLTQEQVNAKEKIKNRVTHDYDTDKTGQLILVAGEAGPGKTVLMSNLFYDIFHLKEEYPELTKLHDLDVRLTVNHDEQLKVYDDIAVKLGMNSRTIQ